MPRSVSFGGRPSKWLAAILLVARVAWADSPLTSTDLAAAYGDLAEVQDARKDRLTPGVLSFLLSDAGNDRKLAVANALGWGKPHAVPFLSAVAHRLHLDAAQLAATDLSPSDLFVAGYLAAMGDYLELGPIQAGGRGVWAKRPQDLLEAAARALPADFPVQCAQALVRAQLVRSTSWCKVFRIPEEVLLRFPLENPQQLRLTD